MHRSKTAAILFTFLWIALPPSAALGQGQTDIFLFKIEMDGDRYIFSDPIKVNQTEGYNNQPSFHPDGLSLFFSSGAEANTDIYRFDIESGTMTRLTHTPDSEYSPVVMPGEQRFSVVQLVISEGARQGAQPLLSFPLSGGDPEMIFEDGEKVGYHAWIDGHRVALFLLGSPNYLQIVDLTQGTSLRIADNIGRSLFKIPGKEAISFSQGREGERHTIMMYDLIQNETKTIAPMLEGNGFYAWTPSARLMMGVGSRLFEFDPGMDKDWRMAEDLGQFGILNISRISFDPQGRLLAVVNSR